MLRRSVELDALQLGITRSITGATTDLACTYLPGLDLVQHALFAGDGAQTAAAAAERLAALEQYYVALDALLAPVLQPSRGEIVFVVTAPGRVQHGSEGLFAAVRRGGQHAAEGWIGAAHRRHADRSARPRHPDQPGAGRTATGRDVLGHVRAPFTCAGGEHLRIASRRACAADGTAARSGNDRSAAQPRVREISRGQPLPRASTGGTGEQEICSSKLGECLRSKHVSWIYTQSLLPSCPSC